MRRSGIIATLFVYYLFGSGLRFPIYAEELPQPAQEATQPAAAMESAPSAGFEAAMKLYRRGRYAQAIEAFDAVLQSEPDNSAAHYFKGYAQYVTRQYAESVASFSQAFQKNPSFDPRPYFHRR